MSDPTASLGEFLRHERERKGITIEQVASATKISVKVLHALEGDQFRDLPAKPFIRGFVNSYCKFIGLDSQEVLSRFDSFIDSHLHERPRRDAGHSGYAFEKRDGEQTKTILWIVMGCFVVLGGIVMFALKPALRHRHHHGAETLRQVYAAASPSPKAPSARIASVESSKTATHGATTPKPTLVATAASPTPTKAPTPTKTATPTPTPTPTTAEAKPDRLNSGINLKPREIRYKVIFKAMAPIWVRYKVDERPMMKFTIAKDRALVLRAKEKIVFQVSNPKSVTFNLNGRGAAPLMSASQLEFRQNTATLVIPAEVGDSAAEFLNSEKPLPVTPDPN